MTERLGARDGALLLLVAALWGGNFIFSKIKLASFPPLLFPALRFALLAALAPFVAPPSAPWR